MPKEQVPTLLSLSGQDGFFVERLSKHADKPHVDWFVKKEAESHRDYLQRSLRASSDVQSREGSTCRHKGKAPLGVRLPQSTSAAALAKPQVYRAAGAPKRWTSEILIEFLKEQDWKEPQLISPPMGNRGWLFRMTPTSQAHCFGYSLKAGGKSRSQNACESPRLRWRYLCLRLEEASSQTCCQGRSKAKTPTSCSS